MAGIPKVKITGQRPTVFQARRLLIRKGISLPPMSVLPGRQTHATPNVVISLPSIVIAALPAGVIALARQLMRGHLDDVVERINTEAMHFKELLKSDEARAAFEGVPLA
jgi:hypothetical protein